eukprot:11841486-Alexandrium_andersonii.AAC.1
MRNLQARSISRVVCGRSMGGRLPPPSGPYAPAAIPSFSSLVKIGPARELPGWILRPRPILTR